MRIRVDLVALVRKLYVLFTSMHAKARATEAIEMPNMEIRGHISIFEMSKFSLAKFDMNMHVTQQINDTIIAIQ